MRPEETFERVRPMMPAIGATRLANVTGLDALGIPVFTVCRPASRSISVSQGKGLTVAAARASALMEALELHSAERPEVHLVRATADEMRWRGRAISWEGLPRRSADAGADAPLLWAKGTDLLSGRDTWAPWSLVHTDWSHPLPPEASWFVNSSNGLASGNHWLEAVSHAICELVERDAKTLWCCSSASRRRESRVRLDSLDDATCVEVVQRMLAAGVTPAIWDLTSDVGLATFMCMLADNAPNEVRPMPGFVAEGCHPAREIALLRALTEAAQSRLTYIVGSRDDIRMSRYEGAIDPRAISVRTELLKGGADATRRFTDIPTSGADTFQQDVDDQLSRLRRIGVTQVVAVDLTDERLGVPVVRMIVPGLESAHEVPGYVPGTRARSLLDRGTP